MSILFRAIGTLSKRSHVMLVVFSISAIFFIWWIISLFFLPSLLRADRNRILRADKIFIKTVMRIALATYLSGFACNTLVMLANGCKMPAIEFDSGGKPIAKHDDNKCERAHDFLHTCTDNNTKLMPLVDRFRFPSIGYVLSIGDLLLVTGTALMTLQRIWIFLPQKKPPQ